MLFSIKNLKAGRSGCPSSRIVLLASPPIPARLPAAPRLIFGIHATLRSELSDRVAPPPDLSADVVFFFRFGQDLIGLLVGKICSPDHPIELAVKKIRHRLEQAIFNLLGLGTEARPVVLKVSLGLQKPLLVVDLLEIIQSVPEGGEVDSEIGLVLGLDPVRLHGLGESLFRSAEVTLRTAFVPVANDSQFGG